MKNHYETIVVGAGVSGLAYAHARGPEADLLVVDAAPLPGGLIRTVRVDAPVPLRYEWGPEALASASAPTNALLREVGIEPRDVSQTGKRRFLVHGGRVVEVPSSPPALLRSPLLSLRGKLRLLSEPWRASERALDGSLADFARHRLGREALEALLDPIVSGIHAGDPEQLSLRACFPRLASWVEQHGSLFRAMAARRKEGAPKPGLCKPNGGMGELPRALAGSLGPRLELGREVVSIDRRGTGWSVAFEDGALEAERLVVALPLGAARRLLADVAPAVSSALTDMVCESLVSLVHLYEREQVRHALDGFGYLVPAREGLNHLGTLFSSTLDPDAAPEGYVLLRTLLGGARRPALVDASEEMLLALASREVGGLLGIEGEPRWTNVTRHASVLPRFDLRHPARQRTLREALPPGLHLLGNYVDGIGVPGLIEASNTVPDTPPTMPVDAVPHTPAPASVGA